MIVPFDESWREAVGRLWRESFGEEPDALFSTWHWQYDLNPAATTSPVLLFVDGKNVIGMLGAIPVIVDTPHGQVASSWGVDIVVHPDFRGAGVGGYLIRAWDESTGASLSLGVTPAALEVFLASGRTHVGEVPLFKKAIRPDALLAARFGSRLAGTLLGAPARAWLWARERARRTTTRYDWRPVTDAGEAFDALWGDVSASHGVAVRRSAADLRWRFGPEAPGSYMTYGAFDGDGLVAYVVTSTLPRDPILSGCIVDIVCRDADEIREFALSRAVGELRAAGVHVVECLATRPEYRRALIGCGFLERPSPTSLLFHVNDAEGHPGFDGAADLSGWHVTYADSDCLTVVQRDLLTATPVAAG